MLLGAVLPLFGDVVESVLLVPVASVLLLLFFLCFFFPVVSVEDALLWSVLDPEVPFISVLELPLVEPVEPAEDDPLCGDELGEEVLDCCATAIPTENRAAVAIARSFLDIFSPVKWHSIGWLRPQSRLL